MLRPGDDLLVISDDGTIIRMAGEGISQLGRATQGVRLMRLMEGSRVIDVEKTEREAEEDKPEDGEDWITGIVMLLVYLLLSALVPSLSARSKLLIALLAAGVTSVVLYLVKKKKEEKEEEEKLPPV